MKQINIMQAYSALESLADIEEYGVDQQWDLYQLRKELRKYVDFCKEREQIINKKYTAFADENGNIKGQKYVDYLNERAELDNKEIELKDIKITLPLAKGINFKTIEALENFIEFTK